MAKLHGTRICPECGTQFQWDSVLATRYASGHFEAEVIGGPYIHANSVPNRPGESQYEITLDCPHCGLLDTFYCSPEK